MGAVHLDDRSHDTEDREDRGRLGTTGARHGIRHTPGLLHVLYFIPIVGGLISLVAFVWTFACMVVAVRQSLDYTSTWRAFFVILLALIPVLILNGIVFLTVVDTSHFIFIG